MANTHTDTLYQNEGITWPRKLRFATLGPDDIPSHVDLEGCQKDPPSLDLFLKQLYAEANIQDIPVFKKIGTFQDEVTVSGSTYPVVVDKFKSTDGDAGVPTWFERRSDHGEGSGVSFEELDAVLTQEHEKNEGNYTPNIYDVNTLLEWDRSVLAQEVRWNEGDQAANGAKWKAGGFERVEMRITQMHHQMPGGVLSDRVFTVLVVSFFNLHPRPGYSSHTLDMQLPVDLSAFPTTIQSRSHIRHEASSKTLNYDNADAEATPTQKSRNGKEVVEGRYVSLEQVLGRKDVEGKPVTRWEMRTASDAMGNLPLWVQKMGLPGAIVKDVPLAVKYIIEKRGKGVVRG